MAKLTASITLSAALLGALMPAASEASFRRLRSDYTPGEVITAHSRHGNGSISSVVRPGRYGWDVQLPGGAWVGCRRSCEETLRVQTVDLNERQDSISGLGTAQQECGIFGCLGGSFEIPF